MAEKVTLMRLKVDLQCPKCIEKVKKVLSKIPQVRDQVFDDKNNIMTITVVCCSPKKIRDEICCKGGVAIKSIKIVETPKQPDVGDKVIADKRNDKDKPADKPKNKPADKPAESKRKDPRPTKGGGEREKMVADKRNDKDKPADKPKNKPADKPAESKLKDPRPTKGGGEREKKVVADKRNDKDKPTDKPKNKPADKPTESKMKDPRPIPLQLPAVMMVTPKIKVKVEVIKVELSFGV